HPALLPDLGALPAVRGAPGERLQRPLRGLRRGIVGGSEGGRRARLERRSRRAAVAGDRGTRVGRRRSPLGAPWPWRRAGHSAAGPRRREGPPPEPGRPDARAVVPTPRLAAPTMRSRQASIAGSPILIGTVTVLVTVVAVFLAYN